MARIAGINIPPNQHSEIGLTAIFGIGRPRARKICEACGIAYSKKIATAVSAIVVACPCADSVPAPMPGPVKARVNRLHP